MENDALLERIMTRIDLMLDDIKRENENPYLTKAFSDSINALANIYKTRTQWLIDKNKWDNLEKIRKTKR